MTTDPTCALAAGLAVFPLPAGAKRTVAGWPRQVTTDPATVARWPDGLNVGVACRASRVVGLDLDRKQGVDGVDTLRALCAAARWPWPDTLTVATAHGGLHLYFRAPTGIVVPSSIDRWPGVDVRAPGHRLGGYLVGPGSVVDGRPYTISRHPAHRGATALAGREADRLPRGGDATELHARCSPSPVSCRVARRARR